MEIICFILCFVLLFYSHLISFIYLFMNKFNLLTGFFSFFFQFHFLPISHPSIDFSSSPSKPLPSIALLPLSNPVSFCPYPFLFICPCSPFITLILSLRFIPPFPFLYRFTFDLYPSPPFSFLSLPSFFFRFIRPLLFLLYPFPPFSSLSLPSIFLPLSIYSIFHFILLPLHIHISLFIFYLYPSPPFFIFIPLVSLSLTYILSCFQLSFLSFYYLLSVYRFLPHPSSFLLPLTILSFLYHYSFPPSFNFIPILLFPHPLFSSPPPPLLYPPTHFLSPLPHLPNSLLLFPSLPQTPSARSVSRACPRSMAAPHKPGNEAWFITTCWVGCKHRTSA